MVCYPDTAILQIIASIGNFNLIGGIDLSF
jgi:hypothetical protein